MSLGQGMFQGFADPAAGLKLRKAKADVDAKFLTRLESNWRKNVVRTQIEGGIKASEHFSKFFMSKMNGVTKAVKKAKPFVTFGLDLLGIILQVLDAFNVLEPIMSLFGNVLSVIGGGIMETLAPAIAKLAEVLFGPEMMGLWKTLGNAIGKFLGAILNTIASILSDPDFKRVFTRFIETISGVLSVLMIIFKPFFLLLSAMNPQQIGLLFYTLGVGLAFLVGLLVGGPLGPALAVGFAALAALALSPLLFMAEGGIVTRPTLAIIGEKGPEAVIPLGEEGGVSGIGSGDEKLLWATEDNGDKLDLLINLTRSQGRLI